MKLRNQIFTLLLLLYPVTIIKGMQEQPGLHIIRVDKTLKSIEKTIRKLLTPQDNLNIDLVQAVDKNDYESAKNAISKGADVNSTHHYYKTILDAALCKADLSIAQLLIENGADINEKNILGFTRLMTAAEYGKLNLVKFLLENGADPSIISDGRTAIDWAEMNRHHNVANFIKEYTIRRQKEIEESVPLTQVLVELVEEYEGYKTKDSQIKSTTDDVETRLLKRILGPKATGYRPFLESDTG